MREVFSVYCKMKSPRELQKKSIIWLIRDFGTDKGRNDDVTVVKLHPFARNAPEWLGEFIRNVRIEK